MDIKVFLLLVLLVLMKLIQPVEVLHKDMIVVPLNFTKVMKQVNSLAEVISMATILFVVHQLTSPGVVYMVEPSQLKM